MDILLTGGSGQLGSCLRKIRKFQTPSSRELNVTDPESVITAVAKYRPRLVVHAAAYTNVVLADQDPEEARRCYQINVLGTRNVVQACLSLPLVFISTETVLHPYNFYALTKSQAENEVRQHPRHTIIRTSFRNDPFEYAQAPYDMLTIGDTVEKIANLISAAIDLPPQNRLIYVGTGVKTVYDLARQTRPDVRRVSYKEIPHRLAPLVELLNVGFM